MVHAFVNVIESPSSQDLLDGRTEGRMLTESLKLAQIPNSYSLVTDLVTLNCAVDVRMREAAGFHQKVPIVHMSMHGNEHGIELTSGEFVTWADLRTLLMPVMRAVQGTLLICMSSCAGYAAARMAMNDDDEPGYWALVGNTGQPTWSDAAIGYASFYHLFFKELDINTCIESMRVASADHNFILQFGKVTKQNWQQYLEEQGEDQIQNAVSDPTKFGSA